ncbi:hypothetical protein GCM10007423_39610 [Dyadobacter endophyticus]|uniref:Uncharacterized protein n=1 Tax=Dyadobacter endophyticus TaxID=1749036 RepID=A0ABQ1YZL4_9BACT|nr:hypothetical protein [Dyadobacter endophyticus]GGH42758.1 hypothetical protein GCM10007423_39610 [Dyadobacter endophyticus]
MDKQKKKPTIKSDISTIKTIAVSHDTCFSQYFYQTGEQIRRLRNENIVHVKILRVAPVATPDGKIFYRDTPIVFFNN